MGDSVDQAEEVLWHRRKAVCDAVWPEHSERLRDCIIAAAPYGGPVATLRKADDADGQIGVRGEVLATWTAAGRPIASIIWGGDGSRPPRRLGWTADELMICVLDNGHIQLFTANCELVREIRGSDSIAREGMAWRLATWDDGVAIITRTDLRLHVTSGLGPESEVFQWSADLAQVLSVSPRSSSSRSAVRKPCFCVLPSLTGEAKDVRVLVGTPSGRLLVVDSSGSIEDLDIPGGPVKGGPHEPESPRRAGRAKAIVFDAVGDEHKSYVRFAVSPSGLLVACMDTEGIVKILATDDLRTLMDEVDLGSKTEPSQLCWCANDCIVLVFQSRSKNIVFVVCTEKGDMQNAHRYLPLPREPGDPPPDDYAMPVLIVPEVDGCRILGSWKVEAIERLSESDWRSSPSTAGVLNHSAELCRVWESVSRGEASGEDALRQSALEPLERTLNEAVASCLEAARHEYDPERVREFLEAAAFGQANQVMLGEDPQPLMTRTSSRRLGNKHSDADPLGMVHICRSLRICVQLRKPPLDILLTIAQLDSMGGPGKLAMRLARRNLHLLALRLCEWSGVSSEEKLAVMSEWASVQMRKPPRDGEEDLLAEEERLVNCLHSRLRGLPGACSAVAARASRDGRPGVAVKLLLRERNADVQVLGLTQVLRDCHPDDADEVLRFAIEPACVSRHHDLIHGVVALACRAAAHAGAEEQGPARLGELCRRRGRREQLWVSNRDAAGTLAHELSRVGGPSAARLFYSAFDHKSREFCLLYAEQRLEHAVRSSERMAELVDGLVEPGGLTSPSNRQRGRALSAEQIPDVPSPQPNELCDAAALCLRAAEEQNLLLDRQVQLQERALVESWPGGSLDLVGQTLVGTLQCLTQHERHGEAEGLRHAMGMEDRAFFQLKVKVLIALGSTDELRRTAHAMKTRQVPAVLLKPVVAGFVRYGLDHDAAEFQSVIDQSEKGYGIESGARSVMSYFSGLVKPTDHLAG